jgi:hypothetical protein
MREFRGIRRSQFSAIRRVQTNPAPSRNSEAGDIAAGLLRPRPQADRDPRRPRSYCVRDTGGRRISSRYRARMINAMTVVAPAAASNIGASQCAHTNNGSR